MTLFGQRADFGTLFAVSESYCWRLSLLHVKESIV